MAEAGLRLVDFYARLGQIKAEEKAVQLRGSQPSGEWRGVAGLLLIFASLAYKVRVEESWLTGHFGRAYSQYRRDVAALCASFNPYANFSK